MEFLELYWTHQANWQKVTWKKFAKYDRKISTSDENVASLLSDVPTLALFSDQFFKGTEFFLVHIL